MRKLITTCLTALLVLPSVCTAQTLNSEDMIVVKFVNSNNMLSPMTVNPVQAMQQFSTTSEQIAYQSIMATSFANIALNVVYPPAGLNTYVQVYGNARNPNQGANWFTSAVGTITAMNDSTNPSTVTAWILNLTIGTTSLSCTFGSSFLSGTCYSPNASGGFYSSPAVIASVAPQ